MTDSTLVQVAYDLVKYKHYTAVLFCRPETSIRWWAKLLGHYHPIHHVSVLYYSDVAHEVLETEMTYNGVRHTPVYNAESLDDIDDVLILPNVHKHTLCHPDTKVTWRSLLRSGVDHTFPPLSKLIARAILRVFGDDTPTPITCSGYVLELLTGTRSRYDMTAPPHILKEILIQLL